MGTLGGIVDAGSPEGRGAASGDASGVPTPPTGPLEGEAGPIPGAGVDPGVSLSGTTPLAYTGGSPVPLVVIGAVLVLVAWAVRRKLVRR